MSGAEPGVAGRGADPVRTASALKQELRTRAAALDERGGSPDQQVQSLRKSGLLDLFVPEDLGGRDADYQTAAAVMTHVAEGDAALAQMLLAHYWGVERLKIAGATEIIRAVLPRVVAEGLLIQSAFSERRERPVDYFAATLDRGDGEGCRLSGQKYHCTGSRWADVFYVPCSVQPATDGTAGQESRPGEDRALVWCPADSPGVVIQDDWDGIGQQLAGSWTVSFGGVEVPPESVMGEPSDTTSQAGDYLGSHEVVLLCALLVGVARAALRDGICQVTRARPWAYSGVPKASEDPYTLRRVGALDIAVETAESMLERAAGTLDVARRTRRPQDCAAASVAAARAKAVATESALRVVSEVFQLAATSSVRRRAVYDRHWSNIRTLTADDSIDYRYRLVGAARLHEGSPADLGG